MKREGDEAANWVSTYLLRKTSFSLRDMRIEFGPPSDTGISSRRAILTLKLLKLLIS